MDKELLFKEAFDSIVESDEDKAVEVLKKGEEMGVDPVELLTEGFSAGIKHLGDLFGRGEVFLPELIFATEVMKVVTEDIESKMTGIQSSKKGVMVIGTVEGDVHDIGKGIVASLVKTNGIEVIDLGREVPAKVFIEKAMEHNADIVGSSALLTTTMTVQKDIEEHKEKCLEKEIECDRCQIIFKLKDKGAHDCIREIKNRQNNLLKSIEEIVKNTVQKAFQTYESKLSTSLADIFKENINKLELPTISHPEKSLAEHKLPPVEPDLLIKDEVLDKELEK